MKSYGVNELRKMFLEFFESKDHLALKSFSLIPYNDNSLLLINSGMAPLKPYFTGQEIPPRKRVATCQKCIRTGDIENVGKTARHGTFFEMLGNFSFGDYFKVEAIKWSWEFLVDVLGIDPERLYPSVYEEDDEAFDIWNNHMHIAKERIFRFGKADNFWEHGKGPCGPCSEIYYDRGEKYGCGKPDCTVGCDCDRYMEIWNNVFTQFDGDGNDHYVELEHKNIDTGMGLERLATIVQEVDSIFEVDTIDALLKNVCKIAKVTYMEDATTDISIRVITDHVRSCTFMLSDGIDPSNEGRGYVLRRLLRRAARHGRLLGIKEPFLAKLSEIAIEISKDGYPELDEYRNRILQTIHQEELKFNETIDRGLSILEGMVNDLKSSNSLQLSGEDGFKLYDTYGFPLDLTKEILEEHGLTLDEDGFAAAMKKQRETARMARKTTNYMGAEETVYQQIDPSISSSFNGYHSLEEKANILVLTTNEALVNELTEGSLGTIIVDETPFYATKGGQANDIGIIKTNEAEFIVEDVIKLAGGKIAHVGEVTKGTFKVGDVVSMQVDCENRLATAKNHSATHLLQKALKVVLGDHIEQAGSFVSADRLRFDFKHFSGLSDLEIKQVEALVNEEIAKKLTIQTNEMSIDEAKKTGATALFGEKYGDVVRVVTMGDFSTELCGGTHVENTNQIAFFKIISEAGIAAGVRRIEALTGDNLLQYYKDIEEMYIKAAATAKTSMDKLSEKIQSIIDENKMFSTENESLKKKLANQSAGNVEDKIKVVNGKKLLALAIPDADMNSLRDLGDSFKEKLGSGVVVLASAKDGKVNLLAMVTDDLTKQGVLAGNIIKAIAPEIGGNGGGKPTLAQAGGKNPEGINKALSMVDNLL